MASEEADRVRAKMARGHGILGSTLEEARRRWVENSAEDPVPEGTDFGAVTIAGVACEWVQHPMSVGNGVFMLLHGGGYNSGSCATHRNLAAHISGATQTRVIVPDYRLAPEHPYPAAIRDVLAVYGGLLRDGVLPREIALGGDGAGGGLAATMLLALRDAKGPLPAAAVFMSPWFDLTLGGDSYAMCGTIDANISRRGLREAARMYVGKLDAAHPLLSPIGADLANLPPMMIQSGDMDVMVNDATVFAEKAIAQGGLVDLEVWPEMWNVFQQWVPDVPEASDAVVKIGRFVREHLTLEARPPKDDSVRSSA